MLKRLLLPFLFLWLLCQTACRPAVGDSPVTASVTPVRMATRTPSPPATSADPSATPFSTRTPKPAMTTMSVTPTFGLSTLPDCDSDGCAIPWAGVLERPIGPEDEDRIDLSYPYGSTQNGTLDPHHGVEFYNLQGTPVYAAASGIVVYAGQDDLTVIGPYTGFYGNVVILQHPDILQDQNLFTLYAHLSQVDVKAGQKISVGDRLGRVGSTGAADGPHLHFEVRLGENDYAHTTNPVLWLKPKTNPETDLQEGLVAGYLLDRSGQPLSRFNLSLDRLSADGTVEKRYYLQTYYPVGLNGYPTLNENFVQPDLLPGTYRLVYVVGTLYEMEFELAAGEMMFLTLQVE